MSSDKAEVQGKGHTSSNATETDDVLAQNNSVSVDQQSYQKNISGQLTWL